MLDVSHKNDERVNIVYRASAGDASRDVELPFRVLVVGPFGVQDDTYDNEKIKTVNLQNLDNVIASHNIVLNINVDNKLLNNNESRLNLSLPISSIYDFTPDGVISNVPEFIEILEVRELLQYLCTDLLDSYTVSTYIDNLSNKDIVYNYLKSNGIDLYDIDSIERTSPMTIITELDVRIHAQLDEILHHNKFMRLESSWRSLQFLLEHVPVDDNCTIELLSISKDALLADFEDVPEVTHSKYYEIVYSSEFGQFGGRPYGVIIGNYDFGPSAKDVKLAHYLSVVSSHAHAPFIASADSSMFDVDDISHISRIRDFSSIYEQDKFAKWNAFRQTNESKYFALSLPKFKLRDAYDLNNNDRSVNYRETTNNRANHELWGNSAFAFVTRLIDSFIKYRWCINITGLEDGKVYGINIESHRGAVNDARIPTQALISDRQLKEITALGFMPLSIHKSNNSAIFFASNSVISPKSFSNDKKGRESSLSHHLGSQLQYLFITCRIAHYLKMMQREHIGAWKNKSEVERELNEWMRQYVSDMDNPASSIRAKRPLRRAKIIVNDIASQQDWYVIEMLITPHLKYMGQPFTLEEVGKLEKK